MTYPTSKEIADAVKVQQTVTNSLPPRNPSGRIETLETDYVDLEARVTTLEP